MLHDFLTAHRAELIQHCREKVAKRFAPARPPQAVEHGVPLFLAQLVHTLEDEGLTTTRTESEPSPSPVDTEIGRAAVWLASDFTDYLVGTTLYIDGGMTLYPGFETGG